MVRIADKRIRVFTATFRLLQGRPVNRELPLASTKLPQLLAQRKAAAIATHGREQRRRVSTLRRRTAVQCGAIKEKGGRLTPPEGRQRSRVQADVAARATLLRTRTGARHGYETVTSL